MSTIIRVGISGVLLITVWQSALVLASALLVVQVSSMPPGSASSERNLRAAVRLAPWYPPSTAALARWYTSRYEATGDTSVLQRAMVEVRQLTRIQPAAAEHWAELFILKARLGQYDQEAIDAIQNAARLGPWEPATQYLIIDGGTDAWPFLTPGSRDIVIQMALNALSGASNWLRPSTAQILSDRHFITLVCRHLNPHAVGAIYCTRPDGPP